MFKSTDQLYLTAKFEISFVRFKDAASLRPVSVRASSVFVNPKLGAEFETDKLS